MVGRSDYTRQSSSEVNQAISGKGKAPQRANPNQPRSGGFQNSDSGQPELTLKSLAQPANLALEFSKEWVV